MADLGAIGHCFRVFTTVRFSPAAAVPATLASIAASWTAGTISGTVKSAAGTLLAGVRVNLFRTDTPILAGTTFTNSVGAYSFPFLDTTMTYDVVARDPTNSYNLARFDRVTPV